MEETYINIPEYWANTQVRPRGFTEICDMVETQGRITGIWELKQWDPRTGDVRKRVVNKNVVTDAGAINLLASALASAFNTGPANPFNRLYINNCSGSTTVTTATGTSAITSIACAALPAAIPALTGGVATQVQANFGGSPTQNFTLSGAAAAGATSIPVNSLAPSQSWLIGTPVVPLPNVAENPTNANLVINQTGTLLQAYSTALVAGAFTYTPTTGAGNRSVVATFTFTTTGGFTAGSYSDAWCVNVGSGATSASPTAPFLGNFLCHEINVPMALNSSNNISVSITVKL